MNVIPKPPRDPFGRPFSFSYSKLKNYESCPFRHLHVDLLKDVNDPPSDAVEWGNVLHNALARAIGNDIADNVQRVPRDQVHQTALPAHLAAWQPWVDNIRSYRDYGAKVVTEKNLSIGRDFRPRPWFGDETWYRLRADVIVSDMNMVVARLVDWKTGSRKPDMPQLALSAITMFCCYPSLQAVETFYVWLDGENPDPQYTAMDSASFKREDMASMWNALSGRVQALEHAFMTRFYPPSPSGLCRRHCPVHMCQHYQVGG